MKLNREHLAYETWKHRTLYHDENEAEVQAIRICDTLGLMGNVVQCALGATMRVSSMRVYDYSLDVVSFKAFILCVLSVHKINQQNVEILI